MAATGEPTNIPTSVDALAYIRAKVFIAFHHGKRDRNALLAVAKEAAGELYNRLFAEWPEWLTNLVSQLCEIAIDDCLRYTSEPSPPAALAHTLRKSHL